MGQSSVKAATTARQAQICEFGPFRIDRAERKLLRDGRPVPLTPKAFDLLLLLVESSGRVVEKDELLNRLWTDCVVEEGNLKVTVSMVRKALEEGANGNRYIETIPRRGYRFAADVREFLEDGRELVVREVTRSSITIEQDESSSLRASVRAAANAQYLIGEIKLRKRGATVALAAFAVVAATVFGLYELFGRHKSAALFQVGKIARLTTTGKARVVAISPDGKLFASSL